MSKSVEGAGPLPRNLIHGVEEAVCEALRVGRLKHRSALHSLRIAEGVDLARVVHTVVATNWINARADLNKDCSRQNWRWKLQTQISSANRSPEVVLERAIAAACKLAGRLDWANQIPVASGLLPGAADGRRAVDLAQRLNQYAYELIELKIASDTPLYAAVELLGYASMWLLARRDPPAHRPELLNAKRIDLRVLAPAAFYAPFDVVELEHSIDRGVRSLGREESVELAFQFDVMPEGIARPELLDGPELLKVMEQRRPLHGHA